MRADCVGPLPRRLLQWTSHDGELLPSWLSARDWPWLRDLLAAAAACEGLPLRELLRRWRLGEADPRAGRGAAMARHCLLALVRARTPRPPLPAIVRRAAFAATAAGMSRDAALQQCAHKAGIAAAEVESWLLADLPLSRAMQWPPGLHAAHFALLVNRSLAQGLLLCAESAVLTLRGAARATLRTAWLHGAGLEVLEATADDEVRMRFSAGTGADAPRRRRALGAVLPVLPWARQFELRARCAILGRTVVGSTVVGSTVLSSTVALRLDQTDPLLPGAEPRPFDSALEERFARAFAMAAPQWQLLREPQPCVVGRALVFPDFELRHRDGRRHLLEIAGLRQPSALAGKLAALAALPQLVLCLPRAAVSPELAAHPRIVPFARSVDVTAVLRRLAELAV